MSSVCWCSFSLSSRVFPVSLMCVTAVTCDVKKMSLQKLSSLLVKTLVTLCVHRNIKHPGIQHLSCRRDICLGFLSWNQIFRIWMLICFVFLKHSVKHLHNSLNTGYRWWLRKQKRSERWNFLNALYFKTLCSRLVSTFTVCKVSVVTVLCSGDMSAEMSPYLICFSKMF